MSKLKSERHHWWPECVSQHWSNTDGGVNWLSPDGSVRTSSPNNFGVIGNGHHIKIGHDSSVGSVWDESYENEFHRADDNFPEIIRWLDQLERCDPPFDRSVASQILPQPVQDSRFDEILECVISLAARSPKHRERGASLAEHLRGPLPEQKRNALIGMNNRHTLRNAVRGVKGSGKLMVIFSPEQEFIFGDGFFNNLSLNGEHWNHPKVLAPITPWLSVLFVRPLSYTREPKLVTIVVSPEEADALNRAVQVYSRKMLFYRSEKPVIDEDFSRGQHMSFSDHRNSIDMLIQHILGVPPRDTSLDFLISN